jgi:hypothetical protein
MPPPDSSQWIRGGGTVAVPVHSYRSALQGEVAQFLSDGVANLCVIENAVARPSDPVVQQYRSQLAVFNDEVYHVIGPFAGDQWVDEDLVGAALREANGVLGLVAALANLSDFPCPAGRSSYPLSAQDLRKLAERTSVLFVDAYDGEGYLRWVKDQVVGSGTPLT